MATIAAAESASAIFLNIEILLDLTKAAWGTRGHVSCFLRLSTCHPTECCGQESISLPTIDAAAAASPRHSCRDGWPLSSAFVRCSDAAEDCADGGTRDRTVSAIAVVITVAVAGIAAMAVIGDDAADYSARDRTAGSA